MRANFDSSMSDVLQSYRGIQDLQLQQQQQQEGQPPQGQVYDLRN